MTTTWRGLCLVALVVVSGLAPAGRAQDALPTLDELLGTDGAASSDEAEGTDLPPDQGESELDRLLSGQEIVNEFEHAVDLMRQSATRLSDASDTGLATQRMQEDVLTALDKLIADAERRGEQNSSQSSSSSQQAQQGQQQQQQQASQQSQADASDPQGVAEHARQDGPLGPERAADLASWGNLPARFRDALLQGATDNFSAAYRRLTEEYYRKLAEDPEE